MSFEAAIVEKLTFFTLSNGGFKSRQGFLAVLGEQVDRGV